MSAEKATVAPLSAAARRWLAVEMLLIFFALPGLLIIFRQHLRMMVVPLIIVGGTLFWNALSRSKTFDHEKFLSRREVGRNVLQILKIFVPAGALMTEVAWYFCRAHFLEFPLQRTGFWMLIMIAYPVICVPFQEVIFRGYFFHRYAGLFSRPWHLMVVNAVSFALCHMFYFNWVAPTLTLAGGFLFAWRYQRTGSLWAVAIEHGLWGDLLFTVGLGIYLFSGNIK